MFPATRELDPDLQFPGDPTLLMITTVVAHPVDIALDVMVDIVIEALPAVVITMMIVVDTALLQELADRLMITHPHVVDLRILTVVITHRIHTSMAEPLTIVPLQEIIPQEMLRMIMSDHLAVTKFLLQERTICSLNEERWVHPDF